MPNKACCPKCGHSPVRFGQIAINDVVRTTFFCPECEHRWTSTRYPHVDPDEDVRK